MWSNLKTKADVLETKGLRYVSFFVIKGTAVKRGNSFIIMTSPLGANGCFEYLERKQHS